MELENSQNNALAKLPMLKLGEYEMWEIRINTTFIFGAKAKKPKGRHKDLERSCTSRKSVAPARNRILVYPDSDEEDEEYCSLPHLLSCFQTPQPCAIINSMHHNNTVDIDNMTIEEYEDSSLDEILDELFKIGAETLKKTEHEIPNWCDDLTDHVDSDQEDGELPDLPTFPATNEFASDSE
ncbi:hypothetical protein Tco_1360969 [Tanacetum coccineum]